MRRRRDGIANVVHPKGSASFVDGKEEAEIVTELDFVGHVGKGENRNDGSSYAYSVF